MKKLKHKLCVINLALFLVSFGLLNVSWFSGFNGASSPDHKHLQVSSAHNAVAEGSIQLSEENETESNDSFEIQALELPFLISCIQADFFHLTYSTHSIPVEKTTDPIYIKVCNFRV